MGLDLYKDGFLRGSRKFWDGGGGEKAGGWGERDVFLCIEMEGCFCCICVCRVPSVRLFASA